MTVVIADTSPINYLVLIVRFGTVVLPSTVYEELTAPGTPPMVRDWAAALPDWIHVREPQQVDQSAITGRR
jgi:hypothetical protein